MNLVNESKFGPHKLVVIGLLFAQEFAWDNLRTINKSPVSLLLRFTAVILDNNVIVKQ